LTLQGSQRLLDLWQIRPSTLCPTPYQQAWILLATVLRDPEGAVAMVPRPGAQLQAQPLDLLLGPSVRATTGLPEKPSSGKVPSFVSSETKTSAGRPPIPPDTTHTSTSNTSNSNTSLRNSNIQREMQQQQYNHHHQQYYHYNRLRSTPPRLQSVYDRPAELLRCKGKHESVEA
jgi:hypothetical protein